MLSPVVIGTDGVVMSRRAVLAGGCLCCAGLAGTAQARISPAAMTPLIAPGYRPQETDEKGLWSQYDRIEQDIAGSNLLIKDAKLTAYLQDLSADRRRATCASIWRTCPNSTHSWRRRGSWSCFRAC